MATKTQKPPEGWRERSYDAEDAVKALGIDAEVWTDYPHVSLSLEALEALIKLAQVAATVAS